MERKGIVAGVAALVLACCTVILLRNSITAPKETTPTPPPSGELLTSSKEGYNSVTVYRQENQLVITAESEAAFFDGAQFTVETEGEIAPENVEIVWTAIGGNTEPSEENDRIIAEIKIHDSETLIFDTRINFAKKAFDAVEDMLESN